MAVKKTVKKKPQSPAKKKTGRPSNAEAEKIRLKREEDFEYICQEIDKGKALRNVVGSFMSSATFFDLVDNDEAKQKRYARAIHNRADAFFEEIIEIADNRGGDTFEDAEGNQVVDHAVIQRDRLRVDARKWAASKLNSKKYGDKVDVTSDGEKISVPILSFDPFDHDAGNDSTS